MNELTTIQETPTYQNGTEDEHQSQYLTFCLKDETYGVDILKVQEIRGWSNVTQMPNAPEFIRGVMNLRGSIVPILDLRRRFNMPETEFTAQTVVIVVYIQERTIGMVVDQVSDVIDIPLEEMRPAPDFGTAIDSSFVKGLVPVDEHMIIMLNIEEMLHSCDLLAIDKASQDLPVQEDPFVVNP